MALEVVLKDSSSGTSVEVDANGAAATTTPGYSAAGVAQFGGPAAGPAMFSENDPGILTGTRQVLSPETDADWRLRVAHDHVLDRETFNYTAQNTGKHTHTFTTMTATVSANGLLTNSGNITTTTTGFTFGTFAEFPCAHAAASVYCETNMSLSANISSITSNQIIDVGMFRRGATAAFAPADGAYFRFSSTGITAVINNNGAETSAVLPGTTAILANEKHLYTITITEKAAQFWIDNELCGTLVAPSANAQIFRSATLPWSIRHANVGAPATAVQALITDYTITYGGSLHSSTWAAVGNRSLGAHQGLSGGTMGSLASYANNTTPATAAASNTAALVTGLGGQAHMTAQVTGAVDNIVTSYQVPAGTVAVQGRRLAISGVRISAANLGAAVATTATTIAWTLNFGHTAVSLATAETGSFVTATAKAPRREALGMMFWNVGAVIGATPQNGDIVMQFTNPIYVNPGEFVATAAKFVTGTATASQSIYCHVAFDYGWE